MADTLIRGTIVTTNDVLKDGWIAVTGERIDAVGQGNAPPASTVLDYGANLVLPGLVDGHMHTSSAIGWPGIEGSTRSAAAGGVTTCVDMPYDVPQAVTDADVLADKIGFVERLAHVDMALYGTIRKHPAPPVRRKPGVRRARCAALDGGGPKMAPCRPCPTPAPSPSPLPAPRRKPRRAASGRRPLCARTCAAARNRPAPARFPCPRPTPNRTPDPPWQFAAAAWLG